MPQPASKPIAIAVILRGKDEVLIGLRGDDGPLAGYWEFPGGKVEQGETYEQAVVREALEETGLQVDIVGELPSKEFDYARGRLALRFFRCRPTSVSAAKSLPARFRWVKRCQLHEYRFPPANAELIRVLVFDSTIRHHDSAKGD